MAKRLTRAEVPVELTWNLDDLFVSAEAWEAEMAAIEAAIPGVTQYKGRLGEGAGTLLACLEAYSALYERWVRFSTYSYLRSAEDGTNPVNQGNSARTASLGAKMGAAFSFIRSEILALPAGTVEACLAAEPGLAVYRHYLGKLADEKPYTLSPETEQALAALGEVLGSPYMTYQRSKTSDMQFEAFEDAEGNTLANSFAVFESQWESHADVNIRRKAWDSFVKGLKAYQNTFSATWATEVKKNVVMAKLRGFNSAEEMLLHSQQVSLEAYHNQLDIIFAELAPHMRRYAALKRRVLGLDKLMFVDLKAPLDPEFNPKVSYDEASGMIIEALGVMGQEYSKIMRTALKERWCDLADNVGKSTGAFCSSPYGSHPFILITWTNSMRDTLVLAHELGHAGHFALANRYQHVLNTRPSTYNVEAPSTINELLLAQHIMSKSNDKRMHRYVIMALLSTYYHNFVTHLLEGELQRRIYKLAESGKPITANTLSQTKGAILQEFWGDTVEIDEGARLTWMRQPHYYMGLYPYTYSAGLTAATTVAEMIQQEGQPAVDRWLEVLKAGGTKKPLELMAMAGVDMSKPETIRKAVNFVGSLIADLEKSF